MIYDIVVVGAGASGLMFGSLIKNRKVAIIDSNSNIGMKLKISGGGKCNITNKFMSEEFFDGDRNFVKSVLDRFGSRDLIKFLRDNSLNPILQNRARDGQYFFKSSNSSCFY